MQTAGLYHLGGIVLGPQDSARTTIGHVLDLARQPLTQLQH